MCANSASIIHISRTNWEVSVSFSKKKKLKGKKEEKKEEKKSERKGNKF